jgi:hypothetical protein
MGIAEIINMVARALWFRGLESGLRLEEIDADFRR